MNAAHPHDKTHQAPHQDDPLEAWLHEAAHLLPAQGPIARFVHHNTLHALEHLSFERAVTQASASLGARLPQP